jgi:predicted DNA binding CopG/RHH family protein
MKTRSTALYNYLLASGVVGGSKEDIALAKAQYRKLYKKQWKALHRPRKEIRIEVTLKQLAAIKAKAATAGMRHTPFVRAILLVALNEPLPLLHRDTLLQILQYVSMAAIQIARNGNRAQALRLVREAETALLSYVSQLP